MTFHARESSMCTRSFLHPFFRCQGLCTHCAGPSFVLGSIRIRRKEAGMNSARSPPQIEFLLIKKFDFTEENKMKYAPRKVFIKENGEYVELEYDEFCEMKARDEAYKQKLFIPVQGCLLEVDEKNYKEYYKDKERNKYLHILDVKYRLGSISAMIQYHNEEDFSYIVADEEYDVESRIINKIMTEKLRCVLSQLSSEEKDIIELLFYKCLTQREVAGVLGIPQSTLEHRLKVILKKLKKLIDC